MYWQCDENVKQEIIPEPALCVDRVDVCCVFQPSQEIQQILLHLGVAVVQYTAHHNLQQHTYSPVHRSPQPATAVLIFQATAHHNLQQRYL